MKITFEGIQIEIQDSFRINTGFTLFIYTLKFL